MNRTDVIWVPRKPTPFATGASEARQVVYRCAVCGCACHLTIRENLPAGWTVRPIAGSRWNPASGRALYRCPTCSGEREEEAMSVVNFQGMQSPSQAASDPWAGMVVAPRSKVGTLDEPLATIRGSKSGRPTSMTLTRRAVELIGMHDNRGVQVLVDRERKIIGIRPVGEDVPDVAHIGESCNLSCSVALTVVPGKPGHRYPVTGVAGGGIIIDLSGPGEPVQRGAATR